MKIGVILQRINPKGGIGTVVKAAVQALESAGYDVRQYPESPLGMLTWPLVARRAAKECDLLLYPTNMIAAPDCPKPAVVYTHHKGLLDALPTPESLSNSRTRRRFVNPSYMAAAFRWRCSVALLTKIQADMWRHKPLHLLANSKFTAARFPAGFHVEVVYPPINTATGDHNAGRRQVVTLSRIVRPKMIEFMARVVGDAASFHIVGSTKASPQYARLIRQAFPSARCHFDVTESEKRGVLTESKVYFHAAPEDFGIATVEAMAAGCIPIVPDMWGHRETVPWSALRYRFSDAADARSKLETALQGGFDDYLPKIRRHIRAFDARKFDAGILAAISRALQEAPAR